MFIQERNKIPTQFGKTGALGTLGLPLPAKNWQLTTQGKVGFIIPS